MLAKPEFTRNGTENCVNESAKKVFKLAVEGGKKYVQNYNIQTLAMAIYEELYDYKNVELQTKCSTSLYPALIKYEHTSSGESKNFVRALNGFVSEVVSNYDKIEDGIAPPLPDDYNANLIDHIGFGFDKSMLTLREHADTRSLFGNRWVWYNQSINFEHVCFAIACIVLNTVEFPEYQSLEILSAFLYFLKKYNENKDLMMYFIYHCMKFIRIHYIKPIERGARFWNPQEYMTNLKFGCYIDPNVELYGNVRISPDSDNIFSMFSNAPRSTAETSDRAIWLNWNMVTPMIARFTRDAETIYLEYFTTAKHLNKHSHENAVDFFKHLTSIDIIPRCNYSRNGFVNLYHRCVVDADHENEEDLIELICELLLRVGAVRYHKQGGKFHNAKIGITYFKGPQIKSRVLNITIDELVPRLNQKPKNVTTASLVPYIVKCFIDTNGRINRREYSTSDAQFDKLSKEVEAARNEILGL